MATQKTHKEHSASEKAVSKHKSTDSVDPKILGICALAVIIIIGVIYVATNKNTVSGPLMVALGDNISVSYVGSLTNGTVFDSTAAHGNQPLTFTVGSGQLIQGFDQGVIGMQVNETKNITISANQAYGQVNPSLIIKVPTAQFGNQTVQIGMTVTQTSQTGGAQHQGRITAVNATNVTVDFNSPLAGQTLIFKITVLSINKK